MCYHVSTPKKAKLEAKARKENLVIQGELEEYYHVSGFDRPDLPVTLNTEPDVIQEAEWKLIPFWVKTDVEANKLKPTQNARSETLFTTAMFRNYIPKYRGLLWVDGYFEPSGQENHYVYRPANEIFTLGVVWAPWRDETGDLRNTFSIITTVPSLPIGNIHDRMPLVILEQDRKRWLYAEGQEAIEDFLRPAPDDYLLHHRISERVTAGRKSYNYPEIQQPAPKQDKSQEKDEPQPGTLF